MCKLLLDRGSFADFTSVSNVFIDEYMPNANGEFVKIYLHLLRLLNGTSALSCELSTETIADYFNLLDSDVMRALQFWANEKLLSLSFNLEGQLSGIVMEPVVSKKVISMKQNELLKEASGETFSAPIPENCGVIIPAKKRYTPSQISHFAEDDRIKHLTFLAQTYLGKPLTSGDINSLLYMLNELNFDIDFIEYIMETCISSGCKTLSRIEKKAVEYAKKEITTIEEAKQYENLRLAIYKSIYKIFGLTPKTPIKKEVSYITRWSDEFGFSDEIILEACNRTMEHTHTGSFQYTDKILTNWHENNAHSMDAIEKLDMEHSSKVQETFKPKTVTHSKKVKSFEQRTYDYGDLEQKLIFHRDKKFKKNSSSN